MSIKSWWREFVTRGGELSGNDICSYDPGARTRSTLDGVQINGMFYVVKSNDLHVSGRTIVSCWYFQGGGVCSIRLRDG